MHTHIYRSEIRREKSNEKETIKKNESGDDNDHAKSTIFVLCNIHQIDGTK